jgi:hypothetical protein
MHDDSGVHVNQRSRGMMPEGVLTVPARVVDVPQLWSHWAIGPSPVAEVVSSLASKGRAVMSVAVAHVSFSTTDGRSM